ncbi:MAG TPA: hypothetical protein VKA40_04910 [Nitrososphaera sp.]|jgi:hypothetical protein|nr:hypothetical protein [Nitrososphaera sp.]
MTTTIATATATAVITLLFLPLLTVSSFTQVQEASSFLPYLDLTHDIFMQYPSNWTASTSGI